MSTVVAALVLVIWLVALGFLVGTGWKLADRIRPLG